MPSSVLAATCFVSRRDEDSTAGFQRLLDRSRAEAIAKYIDDGSGTIPGAIVLSAQSNADLIYTRKLKTLSFKIEPNAFLVLDGQHRVFGFALAKTDLRVPVVIYNGLTRKAETRLFIDINTLQKSVPTALLLDIRKLAGNQTEPEKLLGTLFDELSSRSDSPLLGLMSPSSQSPGKISRVTFNTGLRFLFDLFEGQDIEVNYSVVAAYLRVWSEALSRLSLQDVLTKSVVFRAIMAIMPTVVQRVQDRHGAIYTASNFEEILTDSYFRKLRRRLRAAPGNSVKALADTFEAPLRKLVTL
jgi:DGQHR domain-containing protein